MNPRLSDRSITELLWIVSRPPDRKTFAAATAELVIRHKSVVYAQALRIAGKDHTLADDVFQETFIRLFRWLSTLQGKPPLHSFARLLRTFARRAAIDLVRKRREEPLNEILIDETTRDLADACYVQELLEQLDERSRNVLKLAFESGLNTAEIASRLGLKVGHVRVLRHRALRWLRERHETDDSLDSLEKL